MEVFNSDETKYGGTGVGNASPCKVSWEPSHGQETSVSIRIPPFGAVFLKGQGKIRAKPKKKDETGDEAPAKPASKRKDAGVPAPEAVEAPKKRGRKPKAEAAGEDTVAETPKKRGRKPKAAAEAEEKKPARRGRKKASDDAE